MNFLGDMGVASDVILWLRAQGYDAVHLREIGCQRLEDEKIYQMAMDENRIILTMDLVSYG